MPPDPSRFPTTRWTQVLRADAADDAGRQALAWLCERYWYPLYAYVRRRGISSDEAQDLTQEFFGRLIERHTLLHADPERGRFRSFLLVSMKEFPRRPGRLGERRQARSGRPALPLFTMEHGEEMYGREPAHSETPEAIYERRWALALLDGSWNRCRNNTAGAARAVNSGNSKASSRAMARTAAPAPRQTWA